MTVLWGYEGRRCGWRVLALPPLTAGVLAVACLAGGAGGFAAGATAYAVPMVAGLAAAGVVAGERMVELHLTVTTEYRTTVARRLAWLVMTSLIAIAGLVAVLGSAGVLADPLGALAGSAGFALALLGVAGWVAARTRSTAAASTVVLAAWLAKLLVVDQAVRSTAAQTVLLLATAAGALYQARAHLADGELLLREEA